MDRGAWWATVHGVAKCWTRLTLSVSSRDCGHRSLLGASALGLEAKVAWAGHHCFVSSWV